MSFGLNCVYGWVERDTVDSDSVFGKDKCFISWLFKFIGSELISLWMHIKCLMKRMSCLWKKFLMEFNLFMEVQFVKELETSFWDFVHKLFEEMIIWNLYYRTDIFSLFHYIMCILMV